MEAVDCETAAEPGRDCDFWLESREVDIVLDRRRSQDRGGGVVVGVVDSEVLSCSWPNVLFRPRPAPVPASFESCLSCLPIAGRAFPFCSSLTERADADGGVPKRNEGVVSSC